MRNLRSVSGAILLLLGVLWMLQGADVVHIKPVLCFADCEPLVGGSATWVVVGLVVAAVGALLLRRRPPSR
ncbi:MAG: hypothetical protein R2882_13940 [Gemmatimonadales bacterium]